MSLPVLAIAAGDPCGIGPEVILKALRALPSIPARLIVIGDHQVFEAAARRARVRLPAWQVATEYHGTAARSSRLLFLDCGHQGRFTPGKPSRRAGQVSLAYLDRAVALWRAKRIQALVTAPVTKWAVARGKPGFLGQTEYLSRAMGRRDVVMMFASERLRISLLTRHIPLGRVPRAITPRLLRTTVRLTHEALRSSFGIAKPRLALCGINPHAGEASLCGKEEDAVMRPVLRTLRQEGIVCEGPFASDGLFAQADGYDAVICSYHDQGLIPFKMLARDQGCQLSLGLPIPRTSPDHGSALDIAGKGLAHPGSMRYALALAARLARRRT